MNFPSATTDFFVQEYCDITLNSKLEFIELFSLIMSQFFLTLCLNLYLYTLEHKSKWLPWVNSFLALFWLFRGPPNSTFWWFKSVFWPFFCERIVGSLDWRTIAMRACRQIQTVWKGFLFALVLNFRWRDPRIACLFLIESGNSNSRLR